MTDTFTQPTTVQIRRWRNALFAIFGLCGVASASWASRLATVRDALDASTAQIGILLFAFAIGSVVGLLASSHVLARFGARRVIIGALVIGAVGYIVAGLGVTLGPSFAVTFTGLAIFGAMWSLCDVSMNVSGAANERALGRTIMPIFHAFFSIGTVIGAGVGALAEASGLPIAVHLTIVGLTFAVAGVVAAQFLREEHTPAHTHTVDEKPSSWRSRLSIWRDPRTIVIGLIVLGMAFSEGSANDWLTLAMVDGRGTTHATGALIFGVFVAAMTVGRFAGVFLLDRFGRVPVLRASALLAATGLLLLIAVPNVTVSIIGVVLWGLGSCLGFPVGMSAAADNPKTAAARVSAVATIGYAAFLIGPPVIGFLGQHFGILNGLILVLVLITLAGAVSGAARERRT